MMQIFIAHSRQDKTLLQRFLEAFASSPVKAYLAEFEREFTRPASPEIQKAIENSVAVFLLLSPAVLSSQHTSNWVVWESGVASQAKKDIWVFEDPARPVPFPIPHVTNYVPFNSSSKPDFKLLQDIIETYKQNLNAMLIGGSLGACLGAILKGKEGAFIGGLVGSVAGPAIKNAIGSAIYGINITCPYSDCLEKYILRGFIDSFPCPACRRPITFSSAMLNQDLPATTRF